MEDNRNLEQIYRSAVSGLYARLRSNYDYLVNKYGEDGLVLIADMSREYGMSIARRGLDKNVGNDLESVARYLLRIFRTVTYGNDLFGSEFFYDFGFFGAAPFFPHLDDAETYGVAFGVDITVGI